MQCHLLPFPTILAGKGNYIDARIVTDPLRWDFWYSVYIVKHLCAITWHPGSILHINAVLMNMNELTAVFHQKLEAYKTFQNTSRQVLSVELQRYS